MYVIYLCIVFWYYPLFVAICEIWPLKLTYGAYLILSLKSGITHTLHPVSKRHEWGLTGSAQQAHLRQHTAQTVRRRGKGGFFPLKRRAHALTLLSIRFTLKSVQTHISKQFRIEMCVYTLIKANPMSGRVRAHALKGKINFTSTPVHSTLIR